MGLDILDFLMLHISDQTTLTDWLSVTIYFFTFVAACIAAYVAKKSLDENKKKNEPFITIKIEHMKQSIQFFRLKICNEGVGQAFDIKIKILPNNPHKYSILESKVMNKFSTPNFMLEGLTHLSPNELRFSNFLTVGEITNQDQSCNDMFFNLKFKVRVEFKDQYNNLFNKEFLLNFNEYKGAYRFGKELEEQYLEQMKNINKNLQELRKEQLKFNIEYEKAHRDWTEEELREQLMYIDRMKQINKALGKEEEPIEDKRVSKRTSIQQLRKKNK